VERFIGDWGIEHGLKPTRIEGEGPKDEKVAVIGAGPSGLSCAYHLARRGYQVTVFESLPNAGGMLRYGIPVYRLPREVLDAEIQRIVDLGVELQCGTTVGKEMSFADLRNRYDAVYVAIGAHQGRTLGIPGEDGPGIWTGTEFLRHVNSGKKVEIGGNVVVVGGGDTAIDAARVSKRVTLDSAAVSRRMGADVTILYRRTRTEMPAIEREIEEALEEGINIEYLAAPVEILRDAEGRVRAMVVQRMELGEPTTRGAARRCRSRATPELPVETVITAVSQQPQLAELASAELGKGWLNADGWSRTGSTASGPAVTTSASARDHLDRPRPQGRGVHPRVPARWPASGDRPGQTGAARPDEARLVRAQGPRLAARAGAGGAARQAGAGDRQWARRRGCRLRGRALSVLRQVLRL
jgi:NADPH-dependent glutamate synthase beta subunit-like oxidoreductase